MKNLMLGLAVAALCGSAVGATAGTVVTSTKTVGYRNTACNTLSDQSAFTLVTPTFVNTDGEALPITAVTVTGTGTIELKTFGADGEFGDAYTWHAVDDNYTTAGWYKDGNVCTDKTFTKGQGFVTTASTGSDAKICIAGLVPSGKVTYTLAKGYNLVGNPFNSEVQAQKFKLKDASGAFHESLQMIGPAGQMTETLYWVTEAEVGNDSSKSGWYHTDFTRVTDDTSAIAAGVSFLLYTPNGGTLEIKK